MKNSQAKSKQRISGYGEDFIAKREADAMLDMVVYEASRIDSRFLEPACGNGSFLAEILRRKMASLKSRCGKAPGDYEMSAIIALTSIYGAEMLPDNAQECRQRCTNTSPLQDFSEPWTDENLYSKYGLTVAEIAFIESMIRPL